jgi:4a-hydroxytetrahydrobiopterin dehydratase
MRLSDEDIQARMAQLAGWSLREGKLHRDYKFDDFVSAFGFMASCALVAEAANHHPDWSNVWNRVHVDLHTHDAGGITEKDFALAAAMERLASGRAR